MGVCASRRLSGAAAAWSGLPATREVAQSKEGEEDAGGAGGAGDAGCRIRRKEAPRHCLSWPLYSHDRSAESRGCSARPRALEESQPL